MRIVSMLTISGALLSCLGTTAYQLVTFDAAAAGPADAQAGQPLEFATGRRFHVKLTTAKLHIGAVYLDQSEPVSGAQATSCVLPGVYVGEVRGGVDVDLLSPDPVPFSVRGEGTSAPAIVGEVWLTSGDVNADVDKTPILVVEGEAQSPKGDVFPFKAKITISSNRLVPSSDASQPGAHPLCKKRIVSPIPVSVTLASGATLVVRVDPRPFFDNVDFAQLKKVGDAPPSFEFQDDSSDQPSKTLFDGLLSAGGAYQFTVVRP